MTVLGGIFKNKKYIFIAEIGLNHNGDFITAEKMIKEAARAGAQAVKFQTFLPESMNSVYTASLLKYGIEKEQNTFLYDFFSRLTLGKEEYAGLKELADSLGIVFFSTPFDIESVEMLEEIGVELYKVASSEVTNHILLRRIAETKKSVIMSTGISTGEEIEMAVDLLKTAGTPDIVLMHCVSLYPVPRESINLGRVLSLREKFGLETGFSDHSGDNKALELAAALGARIFERHFTLSKEHECPDKNVSFDSEEFKNMIKSVEDVDKIMGNSSIIFNPHEKDVAKMARRSLYAKRFIPEGKIIETDDVIPKRPGVGMPVYTLEKILGKKSNRDIEEDFLIRPEYFSPDKVTQ